MNLDPYKDFLVGKGYGELSVEAKKFQEHVSYMYIIKRQNTWVHLIQSWIEPKI